MSQDRLVVVDTALPVVAVALLTLPAFSAAYRLWRSLRPASRGSAVG